MDQKDRISPEMTVRDVNMKYPQAMAVFEKYGIAGCGGKYGPPESLNFFAQAHRIDCQQLIEDLEKAIQGIPSETVVVGAEKVREESTLYRGFVRAAIVCALTGGAAWGTLLLADINLGRGFSLSVLPFAQAHANVQIYGWVGLFIMGFAYHAIPRFKNAPLQIGETAFLSLILVILSVLTRFIAQPLFEKGPVFSGLLVGSGMFLVVGYTAFLISMVVTLWRAESGAEFYEKFIVASLIWGLISVLLNLSVIFRMVNLNTAFLPPDIDVILRHIQLHGFISLMIIGVSYRLLPGFMGVEGANPKLASWVFVLVNGGILLWIVGAVVGNPGILIAASGVELLAMLAAVFSLNVFRPQRSVVEIGGESPLFQWYIRVAYLWLIVSMVMGTGGLLHEIVAISPQTHTFIDAYRHALAMGFVTTLIFGVAQRILPVWEGKSVYSTSLMIWVFMLVTVGNGLRVLFQSLGDSAGTVGKYGIGGGGAMELAAVGLFSYNIWRTLGPEREAVPEVEKGVSDLGSTEPESIFGPNTRVFEVLHEYPGAGDVLERLGLQGFKDGQSVPKFVTLERLCKTHDVETGKVVAALEEYVSGR